MADNTEKNFWQKFFTELLPLEQRIVLGTVLVLATLFLIGYQALNEGARMAEFDAQWEARAIQRGAGLFQSTCAECHGVDGKGIPGKAPALNAEDLFDGSRLADYGYGGSLESYVELTIAAGRPAWNPAYAAPMPTWSQEYGGPFRPDQVRDLTSYVLNYGCYYDGSCAKEDEVFASEIASLDENRWWDGSFSAPEGCALGEGSADDPTTFDYAAISADLPEGNSDCGLALFNVDLGCAACHSTADETVKVGPSLLGVSGRIPEGYNSIEHYLAESIWNPSAMLVGDFADLMAKDFSTRMDDQNLADVIAYLLTLE